MDFVGRKMTLRTILCLILATSTTRAEPPVLSNQYGAPNSFGGSGGGYSQSGLTNSYGAPLNDYGGGGGGHHGGHDEHQDYVDSQPKSYEFGYAVKDAASGNDFGRRETSDGETVRGEYRVQLPDGRTQIVTYTADWRTGFHADVRYEGVAQYPDQGYPAAIGSGSGNGGYDYAPPSNNIDSGYNGNQGGFNNYQGAGNSYNSPSYNNPFGSNSGDAGNGGYGGSFGQSLSPPPQQSYGVPFH